MKALNDLNNEQCSAVQYFDRHSMVFAGPGTGKTRVITSRISYLFESGLLKAHKKILAITFTNKAANEMKSRVKASGIDNKQIRIGTFHNFCLWVLKSYGDKIGFDRSFTFLAGNQQLALMNQIIRKTSLNMKATDFRSRISSLKNSSSDLSDYITSCHQSKVFNFSEAAEEYSSQLRINKFIDYDDAILFTVTLLKNQPSVLNLFYNAFPYVLIDEMQDTNRMQLELIQLLGTKAKHIMAVADDDQSIYGWRGAIPTVIQDYIRILNAKTFVLNANYRSPQIILDAANKLILNNNNRISKELSGRDTGEDDSFEIVEFDTWEEEAQRVAEQISELHQSGILYKDIIILYRSRHPSLKIIDEALKERNIPFQHFGRNFNYKETLLTETIMLVMKLKADPSNELLVLSLLTDLEERFDYPDLYKYYSEKVGEVNIKSLSKLHIEDSFDEMIKDISKFCLNGITKKPYLNIFNRVCNLLDLETIIDELEVENADEELRHIEHLKDRISKSTAPDFLELISEIELQDDSNHIDPLINKVGISTFHTAKGLEYKVVFIVAIEESFLPGRNGYDEVKVQEERRGLYVAMTRSQNKLFLSYAKHRTDWNGVGGKAKPSRFIDDLLS
ncbi:ATP-dependent helicase [Paenibacillus sp. 19GGS1-52]|uniref:ATP-dependent helicase n=1 Tax=Paenibacillus sp. 19GGS1-52 TaxID=2758563 RepID=UPI001EFA63C6|nr:ATP-dependent helicase [Paenibacillus sp. 19GGS1-52]ULO04849.1 ATP-dependent helicase [Paenibacillus sp. 19GGS1-52]